MLLKKSYTVFEVFIDIQKACDNVNHQKTMELQEKIEILKFDN